MHVHVLNGVNLGMLGTREPDVYGKMALNELESRVYAWARELGLTARCMQTDHEGEYVQAIHEAIRTAGALIVNPGAWTHYAWSLRDAVEGPGVLLAEGLRGRVGLGRQFGQRQGSQPGRGQPRGRGCRSWSSRRSRWWCKGPAARRHRRRSPPTSRRGR